MEHHLKKQGLHHKIKFPSTISLFHHNDNQHTEKRRQELESYLKSIYIHFAPLEIPELDNFLEFSLNTVYFNF